MSETTVIEPQDLATVEPIERESQEIKPEQRVRLARDDAMERIAARRAAALQREERQAEAMNVERHPEAGATRSGDPLDDVPGDEPPVEGNPSADASLRRASERQSGHLYRAPEEQAEPQAAAAPGSPRTVEVEVDGNRLTVTQEQYEELARAGVRAYTTVSRVPPQQQQHTPQPQQGYAPQAGLTPQQQYLQQQAQLQAQQRALAAQQAQQQQQSPALTPQQLEPLAERLQYGGKDAIAAAMAEYGNAVAQLARQGSVSRQELAQLVVAANQQQAAARAQAQLQTDIATLTNEFPMIAADEGLGVFAAVRLGQIRQQLGPQAMNVPQIELYRQACRSVMETVGQRPGQPQAGAARPPSQMSGQAPQQVHVARDDRVFERKRGAPGSVRGLDVRAPAPQSPMPVTGSDIVRRMARARGQNVE